MADVKITNKPERLPVDEKDLGKVHRVSVPKGAFPVRVSIDESGENIIAVIHPGCSHPITVGADIFAASEKDSQLSINPV